MPMFLKVKLVEIEFFWSVEGLLNCGGVLHYIIKMVTTFITDTV